MLVQFAQGLSRKLKPNPTESAAARQVCEMQNALNLFALSKRRTQLSIGFAP